LSESYFSGIQVAILSHQSSPSSFCSC